MIKNRIKDFEKLLEKFVAFQSVSADTRHKKDIAKTAEWLATLARDFGMQVKTIKGFDNPIILARTKTNPKLKTILIYGHYDVQPAQKNDGWKTEPFKLTEKAGRFFGRGSSDNKGQILMHLYTAGKLLMKKKLAYNLIFLIEGNEETGSPNLRKFIEKYKKELTCDCVVISDGEMANGDSPALEASFRGVVNIEIVLRTAKDDLHSGLFGGVVPNASRELSKLISKFHDSKNNVTISGFDGASLNSLKDKKKKVDFKNLTGTKYVFAETLAEYETRTGLLHAIEVTGFVSGYVGDGFRNSVPATASAKINIRVAPGQNPEKLLLAFKKFVLSNVPEYVDVEIKSNEFSSGAVLDLDNPFAKRAREVLKKVYKKEPVTKHSGGTLPIVVDFAEVLNISQVMIPLANEDCGMHSASENITKKTIKNGLLFSEKFFGL